MPSIQELLLPAILILAALIPFVGGFALSFVQMGDFKHAKRTIYISSVLSEALILLWAILTQWTLGFVSIVVLFGTLILVIFTVSMCKYINRKQREYHASRPLSPSNIELKNQCHQLSQEILRFLSDRKAFWMRPTAYNGPKLKAGSKRFEVEQERQLGEVMGLYTQLRLDYVERFSGKYLSLAHTLRDRGIDIVDPTTKALTIRGVSIVEHIDDGATNPLTMEGAAKKLATWANQLPDFEEKPEPIPTRSAFPIQFAFRNAEPFVIQEEIDGETFKVFRVQYENPVRNSGLHVDLKIMQTSEWQNPFPEFFYIESLSTPPSKAGETAGTILWNVVMQSVKDKSKIIFRTPFTTGERPEKMTGLWCNFTVSNDPPALPLKGSFGFWLNIDNDGGLQLFADTQPTI